MGRDEQTNKKQKTNQTKAKELKVQEQQNFILV
jgi:hypothetical protein